MKQKRVSFKVAKALKEAGYPQCGTEYVYVVKESPIHKYGSPLKEGSLVSYEVRNYAICVDAPFAMEVWLWLWRNKGIRILNEFDSAYIWPIGISIGDYEDPEEAIIAAIESLVNENLLK